MYKKSKKYIYLPLALALYAIVMAVMGYPRYRQTGELKEFWIVFGATMLLSILLHFILKRRENNREKFRDDV